MVATLLRNIMDAAEAFAKQAQTTFQGHFNGGESTTKPTTTKTEEAETEMVVTDTATTAKEVDTVEEVNSSSMEEITTIPEVEEEEEEDEEKGGGGGGGGGDEAAAAGSENVETEEADDIPDIPKNDTKKSILSGISGMVRYISHRERVEKGFEVLLDDYNCFKAKAPLESVSIPVTVTTKEVSSEPSEVKEEVITSASTTLSATEDDSLGNLLNAVDKKTEEIVAVRDSPLAEKAGVSDDGKSTSRSVHSGAASLSASSHKSTTSSPRSVVATGSTGNSKKSSKSSANESVASKVSSQPSQQKGLVVNAPVLAKLMAEPSPPEEAVAIVEQKATVVENEEEEDEEEEDGGAGAKPESIEIPAAESTVSASPSRNSSKKSGGTAPIHPTISVLSMGSSSMSVASSTKSRASSKAPSVVLPSPSSKDSKQASAAVQEGSSAMTSVKSILKMFSNDKDDAVVGNEDAVQEIVHVSSSLSRKSTKSVTIAEDANSRHSTVSHTGGAASEVISVKSQQSTGAASLLSAAASNASRNSILSRLSLRSKTSQSGEIRESASATDMNIDVLNKEEVDEAREASELEPITLDPVEEPTPVDERETAVDEILTTGSNASKKSIKSAISRLSAFSKKSTVTANEDKAEAEAVEPSSIVEILRTTGSMLSVKSRKSVLSRLSVSSKRSSKASKSVLNESAMVESPELQPTLSSPVIISSE